MNKPNINEVIYLTKIRGYELKRPVRTKVLDVIGVCATLSNYFVLPNYQTRENLSIRHLDLFDADENEWLSEDECFRQNPELKDEYLSEPKEKKVVVFLDKPVLKSLTGRKHEKAINKKEADNVNHPPHYTTSDIEVIDILEDLSSRYENPNLSYLIATTGKYLFRAPFKGCLVEDLNKAKWYLDRAVEKVSK